MTNKLTDTQLAVKSELDGYRIQMLRGNATARAMVGLFESIDSELAELQELRRNYLALRGEIEDVQSRLYEAENQANEYASELQERRKADSAEPIYQNYPDDGWSDCSKELYEKLTELGCRTRIVYAAPPVLVVPEERRKADEVNKS